MAFQTFVKSQFGDLQIEQVLASPPSVLLGVNDAAAAAIGALGVSTVFDLSVSTVFDNAARIVAAGDDPRSVMRRFGRAPSALVDDGATTTPTTDLPYADLAALTGIDAATGQTLQQELGVTTIRDLAYWPPFLAAKAIMIEAYNPAFGSDVDPEAPAELVPKSGEFGIEQHQYSTVVMFPGPFAAPARELSGVLFDITAEPEAGFDRLRYGARLTYSHVWRPVGVAKGHLLHSLPLAPGESTNIAVIDWTNKSSAATQQSLSESERLNSSNDRARTVSQIANSVANEFTSGSSVTSTESTSVEGSVGGLAGLLVGSASGAMNQQVAATHTVSTGSRDIATNLQQNISDATQQVSSSLRSQRAASVSEVNQAQSEHLATRTVTNYNHMHALTVQYYELVQVYETETRLENAERCIFLPMKPIDFSDERNIVRYLPILRAVALDSGTRSLLADLDEGVGGFSLDFAAGPTRLPSSNLTFPFPVYGTWLADMFRPGLDLNARELTRDGLVAYTGDLDHLTLDYRLQLTNARWSPMRDLAPQTPIVAVNALLEDGTTVRIASSATADADPANIADGMPDGEPVSFGGIRRIWVELEPAYTPQPFPPASSDYFVRLELAVARDEEARWLDCSFLIDSSDTLLDLPTYTVSTPASLTQLGAVLNQNKLYYSQQIWLREDPQARIMQLAPFQLKFGDSVVNLVDHLPPQPLQVVGNYLVYRFTYEEDEEWTTWTSQNVDRSRVTVDTVAVPTGGVFGEAVLGRANAAEKLDITRFFDWQDSPPPAPPQIQALMAGTHTPAQAPDLPTFDKPLVSIQSPVALPDPVTLSSVLGAVTTNGAFRNMSGASATGDAANQALDASGKAATASLNASGQALATVLSAFADALSEKPAAEKSMSDAGAAVNKKADEAKKDAKDAAAGDGTDAGTGTTDGGGGGAGDEGDAGAGDAAPGDGLVGGIAAVTAAAGPARSAVPARNGTGNGGGNGGGTRPAGQRTAIEALIRKALADQGLVTGMPPTPASAGVPPSAASDPAFLNSSLVTDPAFSRVYEFVQMLQLLDDADIVSVIATRLGNLDASVDPLAKYAELVQEITDHNASLDNPARFLYAAQFVKEGVLPDDAGYVLADVAGVRAAALDVAVGRALAVAQTINGGGSAQAALELILGACGAKGVADLDAVSYVLATAHHESGMGRHLTEIANGISTDTVFTRDAFFFDFVPNLKAGYNTLPGNIPAGQALKAAGKISSAADVAAWNGTSYPHGQPAAVKLAARSCDFLMFIARGYVQFRGRKTYAAISKLASLGNVDFVATPDRAADPATAAAILVVEHARRHC